MDQYNSNRAAAKLNKISKDSGSPLRWGELRPLTAQKPSQTIGGTASDPGARTMYVENKLQAARARRGTGV